LFVPIAAVPWHCAVVSGSTHHVANVSGRHKLRFAATNHFAVPSFKPSTVGSRAFPVAIAKIWNALPHNVVSALSIDSVRHQLKNSYLSVVSTSVNLEVVCIT